MMPITPWVLRLIIANVAVYLLQRASPLVENLFVLLPRYLMYRPWTIVTYMFLHGGFGHIFFNMLGLYFFGPRLESSLGGRKFLAVYFAAGIAGGLLSFATPYSAIIGASGAVFGVLVGYAYYWPNDQIYIWGVLPVRAWLFIVIMGALDLLGGFGGAEGGIAHFAHLGGIAGGYVAIRIFDRRARSRNQRSFGPSRTARGRRDIEKWTQIRREKLHEVNRAEYDRIMEKLHDQGVGSLTPDECSFLDNFSHRV